MAHVSLYRKYRPRTFTEIVGQHHVTETLAQSITENRLHHAYLFTGPRGTGKTSTARILAKAVNCEQGPTPTPCNECGQCVSITEGSNVDVIEIDAASHGGVDDVRDLRERVAFAPAGARMKVYIVDECHMLSTAGWNAFLKTVEEPPAHVLFVFATTEPHKVLATILSRTQRFDFRRLAADALAGHVEDIGQREQITFDVGSVALIVRAGDGSARDTLSVLEQVVSFTGPKVTVEGVAEVLGTTDDELLGELAQGIAAGDVPALCRLVQRLADSGHDLRQFARDATEHLRALFLVQTAPDADLVPGTPERLVRLQAQAGRMGQIQLLRAVDLLAECQAQMRRGNTRLPLELALAKAALPEASGDPAALAARLDRLERRSGVSAPAPTAPAPTAAIDGRGDPGQPQSGSTATAVVREAEPVEPPAEPPTTAVASVGVVHGGVDVRVTSPETSPEAGGTDAAVSFELLLQSWPAVLDRIKQQTVRMHALAAMSRPIAFDGSTLNLEFKTGHRFHADQCGGDEGQKVIGGAIHDVLGVRPRLRCTVATHDDGAGDAGHEAEAAAVAEREAMEAAGELPDEEQLHRQAIDTLRRNLGATVMEQHES
jgi:DNA polymerase III subunit gamma/tau